MNVRFKMAESTVRVRSKQAAKKRRSFAWLWISALVVVLAAASAVLAFDLFTGRLGIIPPHFETIEVGANKVIKVPPGGNVQAAIEQANGGDVVELQAGAVYFGEIKLPNKTLTEFITIQTSAASSLAAEKRVSPAQRQLMATIASRGSGRPAISAANGANHFRFVGIEFTAATADYNYGLVILGTGERDPSRLPHDIEIDRSYLHPFKSGTVRRGIALNSADTVIKNSYIEGFGFPNEETQGICGWTGTRNIRILNNYIEGGAENIMFGGADPASADLIPVDIEVRGNYLNKPQEWKDRAAVKTLFELKNAKRVQFVGNYMSNNWEGAAFRITVRNQDGKAPFSTIEDVVIKDNIIVGAGDGINILGKDDSNDSGTLKNLTVSNNLFLNIGGNGFKGGGYFIMVADGENISITNNTAFNDGNIATFHNAPPRAFTFRDNITGHGEYGIHGLSDIRSAESRSFFQNNVFINNNRIDPSGYSFPPGNTIVGDIRDVGFTNPASNDYRLATNSRYRNKGAGGKNIGSDLPPTQPSR